MNVRQGLENRCNTLCELCDATNNLQIYTVPPYTEPTLEHSVLICGVCQQQIVNTSSIDANYWFCLNKSAWSQVPPVQVIAWRILNQIKSQDWAQNLLDSLYFEPVILEWANQITETTVLEKLKHVDCNGVELNAGDNVVIIKDLDVKGASFTAKRGTTVRNISLDHENHEHIEGRVNGQKIVILTKYVKKS